MKIVYRIIVMLFVCNANLVSAQNVYQQISNLLGDTVYYTDEYIVPATEVVSFQSACNWTTSAKKPKPWEITASLQSNFLVIPDDRKTFNITNNSFKFFKIEGHSEATVPTALGNDNQYYLAGNLDGSEVRLETPEGINQEVFLYPYLQTEIGLPLGTSFVGRYTPKSNLKKGSFRLYGLGLKHNIDQYFSKLQEKKINISTQIGYVNEKIGFNYLTLNNATINFNIDKILSTIETYQFQVTASKEYNKFEFLGSLIVNRNFFSYKLSNKEVSDSTSGIDGNALLNELIQSIASNSTLFLGEIASRYSLSKNFYLSGSLAVGKFINTNFGIQYQFNNNK